MVNYFLIFSEPAYTFLKFAPIPMLTPGFCWNFCINAHFAHSKSKINQNIQKKK